MGKTRVFTSEEFDDFAQDARLDDEALLGVVLAIENGLVDANLGGNVVKQRVARKGSGKSGGYRTVLVIKLEDRAVFVKGYAKNDKANLTTRETQALRQLAKDLSALEDAQLELAVAARKLRKIERHEEEDR